MPRHFLRLKMECFYHLPGQTPKLRITSEMLVIINITQYQLFPSTVLPCQPAHYGCGHWMQSPRRSTNAWHMSCTVWCRRPLLNPKRSATLRQVSCVPKSHRTANIFLTHTLFSRRRCGAILHTTSVENSSYLAKFHNFMIIIYGQYRPIHAKTRGPRGPWNAHLRVKIFKSFLFHCLIYNRQHLGV